MGNSKTGHWKTKLATVAELANYFRIGRAAIPGVMEQMGVPKRGRHYPMVRIWLALGVDLDTVQDATVLKEPLAELKDVALLLVESQKTTRRRSDGLHKDGPMPAYIDLGPRKRLFFGAEIHAWLTGQPKPFARQQSNLAFIPEGKQKTGRPSKSHAAPSIDAARSPAVVNLFLAPPKKVMSQT